jgi:hypothetical protein
MLPNIIFRDEAKYRRDRDHWRSWVSPYAPDDVVTSGYSQPPVLAEAVVRVGASLDPAERRLWYKLMYPHLLSYHEWLYNERDPHDEGLVLQIHPCETGMDDNPAWMSELHQHLMPVWVRLIEKLRIDKLINHFRLDLKVAPFEQRILISESLALFSTDLRLRRKSYDINRILDHALFSIEDLGFNCIFIRANQHLKAIAKYIHKDLPSELSEKMKKTEEELGIHYLINTFQEIL